MAYENLCMYCFEDNGGQDVCPHCGRDARAAVPQVQLLPGTLLYNERFLVGRALGQDASGIVYAALDTKRGVKIRIREHLPRDSARRLNSGEVVPESGAEDAFDAGLKKLRASVEGVEDPSKRHFFFEENGTGYIAQRKAAAGAAEGDEEKRGPNVALVIGIAAALVLAVAVGVIMLVNFLTNRTDTKAEEPRTSSEDIWSPPESPTPTPYAAATFGTITDPEQSWKDYTNPDLTGDNSDYATPTPVPTAESGFSTDKTINANSSSSDIKKLQKLLKNLGWLSSDQISGEYDGATKQAVKDAQQYINDTYAFTPKLSVDGIAGPKTLGWLVRTDLSVRPTPTPAPITPNPTQASQVIDENSSKQEIKYVQSQLAILGILDANQIDGVYGDSTRAAVLYFQQRVNDLQGYDALQETGTADASTLAYLDYYVEWWQDKQSETPEPSTSPSPTPTLPIEGEVIDENSPAASIKAVQEMLIALGYLDGTADGAYGQKTYAAVKSFQNFVNIQHGDVVAVTGKTDEVTRNYLEFYYDNLVASSPTPVALGTPEISVSGAAASENGVYYVDESGVDISWSAQGADSYSVFLQDDAGAVVRKQENTSATSLNFPQDYLSSSGVFTFTVVAIPEGGDATDGTQASVSLRSGTGNTVEPTVEPSPTPAGLKPEITVTDAEGYQDGVYQIGESGAVVSWSAGGAGAYSLYVSDEGNNILWSQQNTTLTSYQLETSGMEPGARYTFSVVAIPEGGVEKDGEYSSVRLTLADGVGVTPEPSATAANDVEAPVITVTGQLGERDGIYWVGDEPITISWSAAGHVLAYSMYQKNAQGTVLSQQPETNETSITITPDAMTAGQPYTIEVVAIPEGGSEADGKSASVDIQLYAGETAEPTVGEVEAPVITVSGYKEFSDGIYYGDTDGLAFSWTAAGDVASYDLIIVGTDGSTLYDKTGVTKTSSGFDKNMQPGVEYTFTVTAVPVNGTAADGASASIQMALYEQQEVGTPEIVVTGAASEENGGYWVGDDDITISWSAKNAARFDVTVEKSDSTSRSLLSDSTDTSIDVKATDFLEGITYRVTVTAIPGGGSAADGKTAAVLLAKLVETPEVGTPAINVTGASSEEGGVYYVGEDSLAITWSAENTTQYSAYLTDSSDEIVNSEKNTDKTAMTLKPENMASDETYTLTIVAIPEGGAEADGKSASVKLARSKALEVGTPEITVSGQVDYTNGIYWKGDGDLTISWSADNAEKYRVVLTDSGGNVEIDTGDTTDKSAPLSSNKLREGEVFTLTVYAIPASGIQADVKSASVSVALYEEAVEVGTPEISVSGQVEYTDGVYWKGDGDLTIDWSATNAGSFRVTLTDEGGNIALDTGETTETSAPLTSKKLVKGEVFTLTVYAIPEGGALADGKSASVSVALYEEAVEVGTPEISVSGQVGYSNETYWKGDADLTINWSAANAGSYRVILTDSVGDVVIDTKETSGESAPLSSNKLKQGEVYTLTVYAFPEDGNQGDGKSASVMIALQPEVIETQPPVADYIDKDSDSGYITAMQTALYNLGWLSGDALPEKGTFGSMTRQAVYDFQMYVATEGINPEIGIIDPADENASVDAATLTTLYDEQNPVAKP